MKIVLLVPEDKNGQYENQLLSDHNALNLRENIRDEDELVVITSDDQLDDHIDDVEVIISSPFLPAYVDADRQEKAKNLKLSITAGVGSDHVDLDAAKENGITVVEITGSNQVSTAEQAVLTAIVLLRNFPEGSRQAREGEWDLPKVGNNAYDVEGKTIGIFGYGKIGEMVAERLKPFGVNIQHFDPAKDEDTELSKSVESFDKLLETSDLITIHTPLTNSTRGKFDEDAFDKMKDGAILVNVARGAIIDEDALTEALESGKIRAYGGDVWYPQPAPADHPWRDLPLAQNAMVPHMGGMTIDAQKRIADGTLELLNKHINGEEIDEKHVIVSGDGTMSASYTVE